MSEPINPNDVEPSQWGPPSTTLPIEPAPAKKKGRTGLVVLAVIAIAVIVGVAVNKGGPSTPTTPTSPPKAPVASVAPVVTLARVVYEITGSAPTADLTFQTASGTSQQQDVKVPVQLAPISMPHGSFAYISAQNKGTSGTITCRIMVDGTLISTNTSSGGYVIAQCDGTAP